MRTVSLTLLALLAASCSSALTPVRLSAPVPTDASQTLDCARRELNRMGYTTPATQSGMSVTGVYRNERPWYLRWIGFRDTADQITASVDGGELRVTALSSDPTDPEAGGPAQGTATGATAGAQRSAQHLVRVCGRQG